MSFIRGGASPAMTGDAFPPLEMWAGVECTINRVGPRFRDQLEYAGSYLRFDDAQRLVDLGIRAVRWPVLWERHEQFPEAWRHTDVALETFREHGIEVIAGLVHHGSGPRHTSLIDDTFITGLADFAAQVAQRYPWVRQYTPVNEPLTTARFSALYGHWYPHHQHDESFVRAMLVQARAIQCAMHSIRSITPDATLVQTEDLGYTHSTAPLAYQASFENERRWLTFDLLNGLVDRSHPMYRYLARWRHSRELLAHITEDAANLQLRPAIIGVNHYLTSERFLDHRLEVYPPFMHGGNSRDRYVDVEAVRVVEEGALGPSRLLQQVGARYSQPIAITEAHLACSREQQMRWLMDVWNGALEARRTGVDVKAVTAWSAFGSFDWRSLLTKEDLAYESGLYDVRAPEPRETALVAMVRSLATVGEFEHPALDCAPWWQRPDRIHYPAPPGPQAAPAPTRSRPTRPLLVTGAAGTLGRAVYRIAEERGLCCVGKSRRELDVTLRDAVRSELDTLEPWAVVNAAGWVRVDDAESDADECMRSNAVASQILAEECADRGIAFVTFSSDLVFGGDELRPYVESDEPGPLNVYGRSKAESELLVLDAMDDALVIRTSAFFGDWDDWNFVSRALATLHEGGQVLAPDDAVVSPTYVADLVHTTLDLLIDGEFGVWHLANVGALSWLDLARLAAEGAGFDANRIAPCAGHDIGWTAPRPRWSVLGSERATLLPAVDDALGRYFKSRAWERVARTLRPDSMPAGHHGAFNGHLAHQHVTT